MSGLLLVLTAFACSLVQLAQGEHNDDHPAFPELPQVANVVVEATITEKNYTSTLTENYNAAMNIVRVSRHFKNHKVTKVANFNTMQEHVLSHNDNMCKIQAIEPRTASRIIANTTTHSIKSTTDFYLHTKDIDYSYVGKDVARGIPCNTWKGGESKTLTLQKKTVSMNYTLLWYFADSDWKFHGEPTLKNIPVRAVLEGVEYDPATDRVTKSFYHNYEYVDFNNDTISNHVFVPPFKDTDMHHRCPYFVNKPIPEFPENWVATIETNIQNKERTMIVHEAYDYQNNRVSVSHTRDGKRQTGLSLFDSLTHYRIDHTSKTCQTEPIDPKKDFRLHEGHLGHSRDFFEHIYDTTYTYLGQDEARGIQCDVWKAHMDQEIPRKDGSLKSYRLQLTWYWAAETWNTPKAPVRLYLRGLVSNYTVPEGGNVTDFVGRMFEHTYDFVNFRAGVPDGSHFSLPKFCPGAAASPTPSPGDGGKKRSLPLMPDDFSTTISAVITEKAYAFEQREHYDYTNNRVRTEIHDSSRRGPDLVNIIEFSTGTAYSFSPATKECNKTGIDKRTARMYIEPPPSGGGMPPPPPTNGHIKTSASFFKDLPKNFTYSGRKTARGIECDTWKGVFSHSMGPAGSIKYTLTWFWAVINWSVSGLPDHDVPVRLVLDGEMTRLVNETETTTKFYHNYEFIDFVPLIPSPELFILPTFCTGGTASPETGKESGGKKQRAAGDANSTSGQPGIVIGFIVAVLGGMVLGALVHYCVSKKVQKNFRYSANLESPPVGGQQEMGNI